MEGNGQTALDVLSLSGTIRLMSLMLGDWPRGYGLPGVVGVGRRGDDGYRGDKEGSDPEEGT